MHRECLAVIESALQGGEMVFVTSQLTLLEALVHPLRDNDQTRENIIRKFLTPSSFLIAPEITLPILEMALHLRVAHGLRSPDAIHVATGIKHGCEQFLTRDQKWKSIGLPVVDIFSFAELLHG